MVENMSRNEPEFDQNEAGYTLTELLVVLVIIALLTGIVAPRLIGRVGGAKSTTAKTQIENLASSLEIYKLDVGDFPTEEQGLDALVIQPDGVEGWLGPYLRKDAVPVDPWGNEYQYSLIKNGEQIVIISLGKDGTEGGEGENRDVSSRT